MHRCDSLLHGLCDLSCHKWEPALRTTMNATAALLLVAGTSTAAMCRTPHSSCGALSQGFLGRLEMTPEEVSAKEIAHPPLPPRLRLRIHHVRMI